MKVETLQARRENLASQITDGSIVVLLSGTAPKRTADQFYEFAVWRNFLYFTNIDKPKMAYVMKKSGGTVQNFLFVDEVPELEEKWSGVRMRKNVASEISGIALENVFSFNELRAIIGKWMASEALENAYLDFDRTSYNHPDTEQIVFAKELGEKYPHLNLRNVYMMIATMRRVKSEEEITNIRKATTITQLGIEAMMKAAKPGMKENEIEAYFDFTVKSAGARDKAFHTIAAAGANATILHYEDNNANANDGDLILFDLGAAWSNYSSDISRTFPVNGRFTPRQAEIYQAVLDVEKATIEKIKPGVKMSELNAFAKQALTDACKKLGLIIKDEDVANYYYHTIGHSLGLDTHDVGGREFTLEPGVVITIEPGLYIAEESIGIRIEDDILVTESGYENLSQGIIKEIADIEAFMKSSPPMK